MVVIAHEQVSPTYVRTDQLISSLIHSEVRVHTIHLSEQNQHKGIFRRLGRAVTAGTVWVAEALIEEDRQEYSSEETARMLRAMSDETGGIACSAVDAKAALGCAETIAARINESTRSGAGDLSTADSGRKP